MTSTAIQATAVRDEAKLIASVVTKGDLSALNEAELTAYYARMCEELGLTAATQPFALLKLNGKLIMYPTRGATDQLAAIHRLNREIVDGPRVIDVAGTKMIYAVCRASHPNGRVETAVATVPLNDPINGLMKAETKAKRRATLSILGLGMLDETELDTIPASAKVEVSVPPPARVDAPAATGKGATVANAADAAVDLAKRWSERVATATVAQLEQHAERVVRLSEPLRDHVLAGYCARWAELAKSDSTVAQRAHSLKGDLRDLVLRAFDAAGIEGAVSE
ncbi:MAG: hypothetical protein JNK05_34790 [Myxococcales bacterium]|nr:hypothetical protein [Myxococcales bacterium]